MADAEKILSGIQRRRERTLETALTGYWLEREDCPGRMFAGTTPAEVAATLAVELQDDFDSKLPSDEVSIIRLVPYETSQNEIDALPEFQGW